MLERVGLTTLVSLSFQCPEYKPHKLEDILRHSKCCKARLLHYFPMDSSSSSNTKNDDTNFSNWCGWHNDHGSITGLFPALYIENGRIVECPDQQSGLYIKSRSGALVHAMLPPKSLAFQVGETMQIHTGGLLQATPHGENSIYVTNSDHIILIICLLLYSKAVRGCASKNVTRETFAVFMEPE